MIWRKEFFRRVWQASGCGSRSSEAGHQCRRFEAPTAPAASRAAL